MMDKTGWGAWPFVGEWLDHALGGASEVPGAPTARPYGEGGVRTMWVGESRSQES